ncbi:hypothetical protein [Arenimonas caeni]|jgi:hypothetical protein|uniref:hypothetical protein n=1 Tax=Arenimonas caeni TaxID=2058085 RepID=UPI002A358AF7|nr:hypothetical protein [Arenimonas caeni]MDY0022456.1 hypothetical protein [Arenimonas caeni]
MATIEDLIARAVLAPSSHNTQPWLFRPGEGHVDLLADRTRALPVNDPDDRELVISCGAALLTLRAAAAGAGLQARVREWPDAADADWLARIELHEGEPDTAFAALAPAIETRRTWRKVFSARVGARDRQLAEGSPLLSVLGTPGDSPADWLRAGQALQRALLAGVVHGLQASYLNQPVELPELRGRVQALVPEAGVPQLVMRWGHVDAMLPAAPRRPLRDVMA